MTLPQARQLVMLALANFPSLQDKDMSKTAILWAKLLADMEYDLVEAALAKVLITAKFFPTVAEIRAAADSLVKKDGAPPPAEEAWLEVISQLDPYKAPKYSHELIHRAVKVMGYRNLCESERPGLDRTQFMNIYGTLSERHKDAVNNEVVLVITGKMPLMLP